MRYLSWSRSTYQPIIGVEAYTYHWGYHADSKFQERTTLTTNTRKVPGRYQMRYQVRRTFNSTAIQAITKGPSLNCVKL